MSLTPRASLIRALALLKECTEVTSEETERVATDASISAQDKKDPHEVLGKFVNEWTTLNARPCFH